MIGKIHVFTEKRGRQKLPGKDEKQKWKNYFYMALRRKKKKK